MQALLGGSNATRSLESHPVAGPVPVLADEGASLIVFLAPKERPSTGEAPPFVLPAGSDLVTA